MPSILRRERIPVWPRGIVGSIAHTHTHGVPPPSSHAVPGGAASPRGTASAGGTNAGGGAASGGNAPPPAAQPARLAAVAVVAPAGSGSVPAGKGAAPGPAPAGAGPGYRGLGVDVERIDRDPGSIATRILRPEERQALAGQPPSLVTLWFGVKECIFKALHPATGVYLGFQDARIAWPGTVPRPEAGGRGVLEWELLRDCGAGYPAGLRGPAAWCATETWLVTGVWVR